MNNRMERFVAVLIVGLTLTIAYAIIATARAVVNEHYTPPCRTVGHLEVPCE